MSASETELDWMTFARDEALSAADAEQERVAANLALGVGPQLVVRLALARDLRLERVHDVGIELGTRLPRWT